MAQKTIFSLQLKAFLHWSLNVHTYIHAQCTKKVKTFAPTPQILKSFFRIGFRWSNLKPTLSKKIQINTRKKERFVENKTSANVEGKSSHTTNWHWFMMCYKSNVRKVFAAIVQSKSAEKKNNVWTNSQNIIFPTKRSWEKIGMCTYTLKERTPLRPRKM